MAAPNKVVKKGRKRSVTEAQAHIHASFNNTIVTITDSQGKVIVWSTAGKMGHKGSRKSTPFAAQQAANDAGQRAKDSYSVEAVDVFVSGIGPGGESSIKGLASAGIRIRSITSVTGVPHNGCRPKKKRRV